MGNSLVKPSWIGKREVWLRQLLERQDPTWLDRIWLSLLHVISFGYLGAQSLHRGLYRAGLMRVTPPPLFTISIGNIACGGSGKTPFTALLAREFRKAGYRLALLSRGYRGQVGKGIGEMCKGAGPLLKASDGDEAYWLATRFPDSFVFVGKERTQALKMAKEQGAQVALVDDGFQHYKMGRDSDVVILSANEVLTPPYILPRGWLRESPNRLKQADLIVLHHVESSERFDALSKQVAHYTAAPIIGTAPIRAECVDRDGSRMDIAGKNVAAFCGIAKPKNFFTQLERLGAKLIKKLELPDHLRMSPSALASWALEAKESGAEWIVCTEKDWVKIAQEELLPLSITFLQIDYEVIYNRNLFENWLERAKNKGRL